MTASEAKNQHIADMTEMFCREEAAVHGFGSVTVRIAYHEHLPRQVNVLARRPAYRTGKGKASTATKQQPIGVTARSSHFDRMLDTSYNRNGEPN